jgi:hypothetical protein
VLTDVVKYSLVKCSEVVYSSITPVMFFWFNFYQCISVRYIYIYIYMVVCFVCFCLIL